MNSFDCRLAASIGSQPSLTLLRTNDNEIKLFPRRLHSHYPIQAEMCPPVEEEKGLWMMRGGSAPLRAADIVNNP